MSPVFAVLSLLALCFGSMGSAGVLNLSDLRTRQVVAAALEDPDIVQWSKDRSRIRSTQPDSIELLAAKLRRGGVPVTGEQSKLILMQALYNGSSLPAAGPARAQALTRELPNWHSRNRHGFMTELRQAVELGPKWTQPRKRTGLSVDAWMKAVLASDGSLISRGRAQQVKIYKDSNRAYSAGVEDYIQYLGNFKDGRGRTGYDVLVPADTFDALATSGRIDANGHPVQLSEDDLLQRRESFRARMAQQSPDSAKLKRALNYSFFEQDIRPGQFRFVRLSDSYARLVAMSDQESLIKQSMYRRQSLKGPASPSAVALAFILVDSVSMFGSDPSGAGEVRGRDIAQYSLDVAEAAGSGSKALARSRMPIARRIARAPALARASRLAGRANIAFQAVLLASSVHRYMTGNIGVREFSTLMLGQAGMLAGAKLGALVGAWGGPIGLVLGTIVGGALGYFGGEMAASAVWGHLDEADREYYLAVLAGRLFAR